MAQVGPWEAPPVLPGFRVTNKDLLQTQVFLAVLKFLKCLLLYIRRRYCSSITFCCNGVRY
jgi:hypothetical protein